MTCAPFSAWSIEPGGSETRPMNCLDWYDAYAFCIWDGGFLPTEAEWNFAAAGGGEQRLYPWSVPPTSQTIDASYAVYEVDATAPVGSKSPNGDARWGHADMAGNVMDGPSTRSRTCTRVAVVWIAPTSLPLATRRFGEAISVGPRRYRWSRIERAGLRTRTSTRAGCAARGAAPDEPAVKRPPRAATLRVCSLAIWSRTNTGCCARSERAPWAGSGLPRTS